MTMNDILLQAMLKCAKEYNPKDLTAWTDKQGLAKTALDLAVMLKHMGYEIVKSPAKEETNGE